MNKFIAYYRVSTQRQGQSGLGLEAQVRAVEQYVGMNTLIASYTEVESSSKDTTDNRPEFQKAVAHAKRTKATLVVAKLDRLARSVYVTSQLQHANIDFVACDNPSANRMTIQILAAVAENEARMISQRTKEALASYKARGGVLGSARPECQNNLSLAASNKGRTKAAMVNRANKISAYEDIRGMMSEWHQAGLTLTAIANKLNDDGHTTRMGKAWNPTQVKRVVEMAA